MLYLFEYNSRQLRREREKKKKRERERERERERARDGEKREEGRTHSYPVARGWAGVPFEVITLSL